jgi:hypothetical protein
LGKVAQLGEGALEEAKGVEGIYEFVGKTGQIYVGQSGNIGLRLAQHLRSGALFSTDISCIPFMEVTGGRINERNCRTASESLNTGFENLQNEQNAIGAAREYLMVPFRN